MRKIQNNILSRTTSIVENREGFSVHKKKSAFFEFLPASNLLRFDEVFLLAKPISDFIKLYNEEYWLWNSCENIFNNSISSFPNIWHAGKILLPHLRCIADKIPSHATPLRYLGIKIELFTHNFNE